MARMTFRNERGEAACLIDGKLHKGSITERLAQYEDTGLEPEEVRGIKTAYDEVQIPYEVVATGADAARVIRLLDAEDEGRLIVLPCKVGDTVFFRDGTTATVTSISFGFYDRRVMIEFEEKHYKGVKIRQHRAFDEFGKTVFLTREEAEAALRKEAEDDDEDMDGL